MAQMACLYPKRGRSLRNVISKILPLTLTADCAAWFSNRRMVRLPFGERELLDSPALSSLPGHIPTHEAIAFGDGNTTALGPTSAIIWTPESTPKPGTS